jgi:osmotically-inducible protein OsmY
MKKFLIIFTLGAAAGAGGYWFFQQAKTKSQLAEAKDRVMYSAWKAGKSLKEFADEIKQELSKSGQVVREKTAAAGSAVSEATVSANLKGKFLLEPGLRSVGVETTNGVVVLTGDVTSHEQIAKAMKIALETDGVQKVVSKIQVSAAKP